MDQGVKDIGFDPADSGSSDIRIGLDSGTQDLSTNDTGIPKEYGSMVLVPSGSFFMGCREERNIECGYECCNSRSRPLHEVQVPEFLIDQVEVTVRAYQACVEDGFCGIRTEPGCNYGVPGRDLHPINCVSYSNAKRFCEWSGKRLCTEAEWEKAARGGCEHNGLDECRAMMRRFPWGDQEVSCNFAVMADYDNQLGPGCGTGSTATVASKPTGISPYKTFDMVGNAFEYVSDCFHPNYINAPTDGSSWEIPCPGDARMTRGGNYGSDRGAISSWTRYSSRPGDETCCGVRCCSNQDQ